MSGLPSGCKPSKFYLQDLDFSIQAQLVLLQPENVLMKGDAARRVFVLQQFLGLGLGQVLLFSEIFDFLLDALNLL